MMEVEQESERLSLSAPAILTALLNEFSAVTDYRTLRDSLPQRLAHLLKCRCVLLYQRLGESLQFASGTFDDVPGWSAALLSVAHINPIDLNSDLPEARAWRSRHAISCPSQSVSGAVESSMPTLVAVPLIYRQRAIGVLVAFRSPQGGVAERERTPKNAFRPRARRLPFVPVQGVEPPLMGVERSENAAGAIYWLSDDLPTLEAVAGVVALLLENTRLLERDRERIHELSLLNSIASQLNCSMYETERVHSIVIQRTREITAADLCELIQPNMPTEASSWITPALRNLLLSHFTSRQSEGLFNPLIIERAGDSMSEYLNHLPANIKTFFAIPLLVSEATLHRYGQSVGKLGAPLKGYPQEVLLQSAARGSRDLKSTTRRFGDASLVASDWRDSQSATRRLGVLIRPSHVPLHVFVQGRKEDASLVASETRWQETSLHEVLDVHGPKVLGVIVGAYHRVWKLRREELVLLQVLASQASAVLENMHLVTEVVEARNEARKLLRRVLDDQRLKELILESVPSGLITVDLAGCITTFNRAAEDILGYHPFEVLGQPLHKILNLSPPTLIHQALAAISETLVTVDRHGQEVALDVHLVPLHSDQREQIGWLATFTDVTSMHRLEEEKRRLDRLASLGEMAASVAHEVRNPLASIKTSMQMLKDDLAGDTSGQITGDQEIGYLSEGTQESVSVVLKEVERLDAIVRDLLLFARPRQLHCVACNLVELSEHVLNIMQAQCADMGVAVHRVYHDVPLIQVDMAQMEQVLFNLYMNAIQAMPEGGVLTVSCQVMPEAHDQGEAKSTIATGSEPPSWLELSVSDTGVGIAPDQLERIFQPFFTTKAHGIGLGLPITRRLVEDHHGHLLVESQPGYGATISLRLPFVRHKEA